MPIFQAVVGIEKLKVRLGSPCDNVFRWGLGVTDESSLLLPGASLHPTPDYNKDHRI